MEARPIVFGFGDLELDEALRELRRDGEPVEIHATPLRLLRYLLRNRDRVVPKQELLDRVWSDATVSEGALSTALSEIRSAVGDDGSKQRVIQTLRGRGYRFIAPVEERLAAGPTAPAAEHRVATDFVGRGSALDRLDAAFEEALGGRGRIVLLTGEAGIGKTRVAEEFAAIVRSRGIPFHGSWCREERGAPPYWPWVQILRGLIRGKATEDLRSELGTGAARIAQLVPEIREQLTDLSDPTKTPAETDSAEARFRLFDAVAGFIGRSCASQPRVLMIDDLHWAGVSSLQVLEFLAREIASTPLLLLGTYRDVEVDRDHPLTATLAELARGDVCMHILLPGLRRDEVRELVQKLSGSDPPEDWVAEVLERTDGNPFFIRELVNLLGERAVGAGPEPEKAADPMMDVPAGVRAVIRSRLQMISPTCNEALAVASALGREFDVETLEAASPLEREPLDRALEEACRAGLVQETSGSGHRFAHALTQQAVYAEQSAHRRAQAHACIGEALERLHAADPDPHLADLAHHFGAARNAEKTVDYAHRAGRLAIHQLAWEEAVEHLERALGALDRCETAHPIRRCDLLLDLASTRHSAGYDYELSRQSFLAAARIARRCGDAERLARAASGFSRHQTIGVFDEPGFHLLEEALDALGPAETPLRANLLCRLALAARAGHQLERADAALGDAAGLARRLGDSEIEALVAHYRVWVLYGQAPLAELLAACDEGLALAEAGGFREIAAAIRLPRIHTLLSMGNLAEAETEVTRLAREAPWYRYARFTLAEFEAMEALLTGRLDEAERLIEVARELAERTRDPTNTTSLFAATYVLRRDQGRLSELEGGLQALVAQQPDLPVWRCALAHLFSELGRADEAHREFEGLALSEFAILPRTDNQWPIAMLLLAEVCVFLEDERRSEVLYRMLEPQADLCVVVGNATLQLGSMARLLGSLAGTRGHFEDAERHFEAALAAHRRLGSVPLLSQTRCDFARMLVSRGGAGDREKALKLLEEALAASRELGLVSLAERAGELQQRAHGAIRLHPRRSRLG